MAIPASDYDFEEANAKFAAADGGGAGVETVVAATGEVDGFYNKKSSFFDDISCEAKDRASGER